MNLHEHFEKITTKVDEAVASTSFPPGEQAAILASLLATIIELSVSAGVLLGKGYLSGVLVIFRAINEAYIDFLNLLDDESYLNVLRFMDLDQKCKMHEECTPENIFVADFVNRDDFNDIVARTKSEKLKYEKLIGKKSSGMKRRFIKANMAEYYIRYMYLCLQSHNNLTSLEKRHIVKTDDFYKVVTFSDETEDANIYCDQILWILMDASVKFYKRFAIGNELIDESKRLYDRFRAEYDR